MAPKVLYLTAVGTQRPDVKPKEPSEMTMKTLVSALVALSFVAGVVAPASAAESFSIKQLDQDSRGGQNIG